MVAETADAHVVLAWVPRALVLVIAGWDGGYDVDCGMNCEC